MSQDKGKLAKWVVPSFGDFSSGSASSAKKRRQDGSQPTPQIKSDSNEIPWVEKYCPKSVGNLAVHKKKVESVYDWLQLALIQPEVPKFCLVKGPAGSGKSTTVKVCGKNLGIDVMEWITPSNFSNFKVFSEENDFPGNKEFDCYKSDRQMFRDFVIKGSRFHSLFSSTGSKKIILIEDWPASFLRDPTPLHEILEEFAQSGKCPLVMITGEDNVFNKLIPENLIRQYSIDVFAFNPMAPTLLKKVLCDISAKEAPSNLNAKDIIESICQSSCGDLRSAINTLQFACLRGFTKGAADAVKGKSQQKSPENKRRRLDEQGQKKQLAKIGGRDAPDDFFHVISKALYAKREDNGALKTSPSQIVEKVTDKSEMFTGFLQENYLDFMPDIQAAAKCAENLELASRLLANSFDRPSLATTGLHVASRGVMSIKRDKNRASFFKSHRKPKYIQAEAGFKELSLDARRTFPFSNASSTALLSELLPFAALIQPHGLSYAQTSVINKLPLDRSRVFLKPNVPPNRLSQNGNEIDAEFKIVEIDSD
ncbi:Hypothetical predicted protein [Cloeon dipterum]|uniref:Cell cycle checkpoint protein RAD17 n=2 Tax=Cloeon dipterum TaxID=197152 RepID=A0A8S1D4E0_9INSE|nr:Hypothetical predicted protein [Cloeon dipterum]